MPPGIHYPDLVPPPGWVAGAQGLQVRLVPPGETLAGSDCAIIVSPLVPRQPLLPPPEKLVEETLFTEARHRLEITKQKGPTAQKAASGLAGVSYEVDGYVRPRSAPEKRIYVIYSDSLCYYAIAYLARATAFEAHVADFWATARSVRPFRGRAVAPTSASPTATLYSD